MEQITKEMTLLEKIEYVESVAQKDVCRELFEASEWQILSAVWEYKAFSEQFKDMEQGNDVDKYLYKMDCEKQYLLNIKVAMEAQIDKILSEQNVDRWFDLLVWHKMVLPSALKKRFWEFYVLEIVLIIFIAECKQCEKNGMPISVIKFQSMQDLLDCYFKTIFLLRRVEYEIEPVNEIIDHVKGRGLSSIYVKKILEAAQIYEKAKVIKKLEEGGLLSDTE